MNMHMISDNSLTGSTLNSDRKICRTKKQLIAQRFNCNTRDLDRNERVTLSADPRIHWCSLVAMQN